MATPSASVPPNGSGSLLEHLREHRADYIALTRMDRPIGTWLLLWPTWWALWIAAEGIPDLSLLFIFTVGTFLMRSAGCVINDYADRDFDGHVKRTENRPLATGALKPRHALILFACLLVVAFLLVLMTNWLTIALSFGAVALAATYPFMKRYTWFPQVVLGAAFSWSIPMAFAATLNDVPTIAWLLYTANVIWTVAYDTEYAMVDRDDDLKIGIRSTAVFFGDGDRAMIALLQAMTLGTLLLVGQRIEAGWPWYVGLVIAAGLFLHQLWSIRNQEREACLRSFLANNRVGAAIFAGLFLNYALA